MATEIHLIIGPVVEYVNGRSSAFHYISLNVSLTRAREGSGGQIEIVSSVNLRESGGGCVREFGQIRGKNGDGCLNKLLSNSKQLEN